MWMPGSRISGGLPAAYAAPDPAATGRAPRKGAVRKLTDHVEATDVAACPCSTWNRTSRTDLTEYC
jgi:hypothetical protein